MKISALTYINLDSRTDKLQNIKNQLENCKFYTFKTSLVYQNIPYTVQT